MKIILIGYGKMGKMLEVKAAERGHTVIAAVDPVIAASSLEAETARAFKVYPSLSALAADEKGRALGDADLAIEFTRPETSPANIRFLAEHKIPVVVGTTGWYDKLDGISAVIAAHSSSLVWASNYSLGVNLFYRVAEFAAKLADPFPDYDVGGSESHHNKKADSPSGTAKILVEKVLAAMTRKTAAVYETLASRPPEAHELHYASFRAGYDPGVHSLVFDSPFDTIEIKHTARNREGFAAGAILAAEWLVSPPGGRKGVFTIDDVLQDILH